MRAPVLVYSLVLLLVAGPASAEVILRSIIWQLSSQEQGKSRLFQPALRWEQPPTLRLQAKPRAVVTLANRGPRSAEGVVLRYAVSARLARIGEAGKEGIWAVPFWLEDRRLPRLKPNQTKEVPIDHLLLERYLKKTFRSGYWPDALKIQVMVEPRNGEGLDQRILEQTLSIDTGPARP